MFNVIKNFIALFIACTFIVLADYASAGSLLFVNGSTTTTLDCGSAAVLDNTGANTRVAIARMSNIDPAATRAVIHKGGGGISNNFVLIGTGTGTLGYSRVYVPTAAEATALWSSFVSTGANEWICMASTFDGTNAPKLYAAEIGAVMIEPSAYATQVAPIGVIGDDSANTEKIGGISGSAFGFPGNIAFVGIWNRALSQSELQSVCNRPNKLDSGNILFVYPGYTGGATEPEFSGYQHTCTRTAATLDIGAPVPLQF